MPKTATCVKLALAKVIKNSLLGVIKTPDAFTHLQSRKVHSYNVHI